MNRKRTKNIALALCMALAACAGLGSCSGSRMTCEIGEFVYKVPSDWKGSLLSDRALFFFIEGDMRLDVVCSANSGVDNLDLIRRNAIGSIFRSPEVTEVEFMTVAGADAHSLRMKALMGGVSCDVLLVSFTHASSGYIFCFSQPSEFSASNLGLAEKIISSISPKPQVQDSGSSPEAAR